MEQLYTIYMTETQIKFLNHFIGEFREYHEEECADLLKSLDDKENVYSEEELED